VDATRLSPRSSASRTFWRGDAERARDPNGFDRPSQAHSAVAERRLGETAARQARSAIWPPNWMRLRRHKRAAKRAKWCWPIWKRARTRFGDYRCLHCQTVAHVRPTARLSAIGAEQLVLGERLALEYDSLPASSRRLGAIGTLYL
jgi:hypothetical protein